MAGYAQLDAEGAIELAGVLATFSRAQLAERSRLLLCLYSTLRSSTRTTCTGYRTLAGLAGVSETKAQRFLTDMEAAGVLVKVGERKSGKATYTERAFVWDLPQKIAEGGCKNPGETAEGGCKNPAILQHIRVHSTQRELPPRGERKLPRGEASEKAAIDGEAMERMTRAAMELDARLGVSPDFQEG